MRAFVVRLNGKRLCTAGIGRNGVLTAIVNWVNGSPRGDREDHFFFHVGGLDSSTDEHVTYDVPELKVGDTVTVRIVETERIDPETKRYKADSSDGG